MADPTQLYVTPRDCALLLAIPLTRDKFLEELATESPKTFAKNYAVKLEDADGDRLWSRYRAYANLSESVADEVAGHGVTVVTNTTLATFLETLSRRAVVTLVAHWEPPRGGGESGCVQLDDGMFSADEIAERIPPDYGGLLDLTVCESLVLGEAIKRRRRGCVVIMNADNARLDFRFVFYRHIIRVLAQAPARYVDVVTALRVGLLKEKA